MVTAKEIGVGIKNARLTAKITQAELARRLGVTPQAVSQYERGIKKPKIETIKKIADALEVSWWQLSHLEDLEMASEAREFYRKDKIRESVYPLIMKLLEITYGKCEYTSVYQMYNECHIYGGYYALDEINNSKRALDNYGMEQIANGVILALSESVSRYANTERTLQDRILKAINETVEELKNDAQENLDFLPDIEKAYQAAKFDREIPTGELELSPAGQVEEEAETK